MNQKTSVSYLIALLAAFAAFNAQPAAAALPQSPSALPGSFNKITPFTNENGISTNPTLDWGASAGASSYTYCIDTLDNSQCDSAWVPTSLTSAGLTGLATFTHYCWQVIAHNAQGDTSANGGAWWCFNTGSESGDPYEPDNTWELSRQFLSNETQVRSLRPAGDSDWIRIDSMVETGLVIETSGPTGDTIIYLYDSGLSLVESNDDISAQNKFSRIDRFCGQDALPAGAYYLKVSQFFAVGLNLYYLDITLDPCDPIYTMSLPLAVR
ncbi:MAG: PPC domain-containing protein [Chloroflexota bacterium]